MILAALAAHTPHMRSAAVSRDDGEGAVLGMAGGAGRRPTTAHLDGAAPFLPGLLQVLALSRLVFEFSSKLEGFMSLVPELLSTVVLLGADPAREVGREVLLTSQPTRRQTDAPIILLLICSTGTHLADVSRSVPFIHSNPLSGLLCLCVVCRWWAQS